MNGLAHLSDLNRAQRAAVEFGVGELETPGPLLIIAGAGTGKTNTLAHRVAHLILNGTAPERILLLTFTRRAAAEMTRRAQRILVSARASAKLAGPGSAGDISWSGTFHAIANRLLREYANSIGIDPSFTVLDRADAADSINLFATSLGSQRRRRGFPARSPASLSIRTPSMHDVPWPTRWRWSFHGAPSGKP